MLPGCHMFITCSVFGPAIISWQAPSLIFNGPEKKIDHPCSWRLWDAGNVINQWGDKRDFVGHRAGTRTLSHSFIRAPTTLEVGNPPPQKKRNHTLPFLFYWSSLSFRATNLIKHLQTFAARQRRYRLVLRGGRVVTRWLYQLTCGASNVSPWTRLASLDCLSVQVFLIII